MRKTVAIIFIIYLALSVCSGCSPFRNFLDTSLIKSDVLLSERHQLKAREYEESGEFQSALLHWKIARKLDAGNSKIEQKIDALNSVLEKESQQHFATGVSHYANHAPDDARREFLAALRCNPNHKEAFNYLKNPPPPPPPEKKPDISPKKKKGAEKEVSQEEKTAEEEKTEEIKADKEAENIENNLAQARQLLQAGQYEKVLSIADKVLDHDYLNAEAEGLRNASYYAIGKKLDEQENYVAAMKMFANADPDYKDVRELIAGLKDRVKKKAEVHYRQGVRHFINEELTEAIAEWEETLRLVPDHKRASQDLESARKIIEKRKAKPQD